MALLACAMLVACSPPASKGTLPPPGPNGEVDVASAPDFIAVAGRDGGIAGYARREKVLAPGEEPYPVYGEDLRTVVGQVVPGKGFVPAGLDPATVPKLPVAAAPSSEAPAHDADAVRLYVRNDSRAEVHVAAMLGDRVTDSGGFWGRNTGAGCYPLATGSRLVLLDRPANDPGALVMRVVYVRGVEAQPPSLWITVGEDGAIEQGEGVPSWWGAPQDC